MERPEQLCVGPSQEKHYIGQWVSPSMNGIQRVAVVGMILFMDHKRQVGAGCSCWESSNDPGTELGAFHGSLFAFTSTVIWYYYLESSNVQTPCQGCQAAKGHLGSKGPGWSLHPGRMGDEGYLIVPCCPFGHIWKCVRMHWTLCNLLRIATLCLLL